MAGETREITRLAIETSRELRAEAKGLCDLARVVRERNLLERDINLLARVKHRQALERAARLVRFDRRAVPPAARANEIAT